jgi:formylglycine-generating enzyme required for sulfatase activity
VFTGLFVDKLSERAGAEDLLTANGLGLYLQLEVGRYTESRQVPYFGYVEDSERGDFVFRVAQPGVKLPEGLLQDLHSPQAGAREDAVEELAYLLRKGEEALAQWAREELTYLSQEDNSPSVQRAALKALEVACLPTPAKLPIAQFIASCTDAMERRHLSFESEIILIPAGPFLMGSSADNPLALDEEKPQHNINLPDYSIARTPVTNAQYANFVAVTGYPVPDHWESVDTLAEKLDHPVVWVSWYDALAYCAWLTETWQERGKIGTDKVVRLPTEAEWEKAARGEDGREYPWGNVFDPTRCNHEGSGIGDTTPVGKYSPRGDSPYSCADMAGNVWEWTSSLWGKGSHKPMFAYPYDLFDGREHLSADDSFRRIIRGGAYYYTADCVRCATRNLKFPYTKHSGGGFRIVVSKRGRC